MKRRRRRKIRVVRVTIFVVAILIVIFVGSKGAGFLINLKQTDTEEVTAKYKAETPVKRDYNEAEKKLAGLSEKYPEFKSIYDNRNEYPQEIIKSLCNTPEMIEFVKGYLDADNKAKGGLTKKEKQAKIPLLIQWDKRWGYAPYGESDIGMAGCAPTCLSMVIVGLTHDESATPYEIAKYAQDNGYYVENTGTSWSLMTEGAADFGVDGREISLDRETVMSNLQQGNPIICSVGPGDFTTEGHFIVLTSVQNNKIKVNDPNSRSRSRLWDYDKIAGQIKNLWAFSLKS